MRRICCSAAGAPSAPAVAPAEEGVPNELDAEQAGENWQTQSYQAEGRDSELATCVLPSACPRFAPVRCAHPRGWHPGPQLPRAGVTQ